MQNAMRILNIHSVESSSILLTPITLQRYHFFAVLFFIFFIFILYLRCNSNYLQVLDNNCAWIASSHFISFASAQHNNNMELFACRRVCLCVCPESLVCVGLLRGCLRQNCRCWLRHGAKRRILDRKWDKYTGIRPEAGIFFFYIYILQIGAFAALPHASCFVFFFSFKGNKLKEDGEYSWMNAKKKKSICVYACRAKRNKRELQLDKLFELNVLSWFLFLLLLPFVRAYQFWCSIHTHFCFYFFSSLLQVFEILRTPKEGKMLSVRFFSALNNLIY